jgi:hypothetical protein
MLVSKLSMHKQVFWVAICELLGPAGGLTKFIKMAVSA